MPQHLNIEVKNLEARMVDVKLWTLEEEEAVMVYHFLATIQMQEYRYILLLLRIIHYVTGFEIKVRREELIRFLVIRDAQAEVAQLMDRSRALLKALCLVHGPVLDGGKVIRQLRERLRGFHGYLSVDQMEGALIDGLIERHALPAARSVGLEDRGRSWERSCSLKILHRIDHESCTAERILCPSCGTV